MSVFDHLAEELLEVSDEAFRSDEELIAEAREQFVILYNLCEKCEENQNEEHTKEIIRLLSCALGQTHQEKLILGLKDKAASVVINMLQAIIDAGALTNIVQVRHALRLLVKLVSACGILPDDLYNSDICLEGSSRDPVKFGGFSDVFRARLNGKTVALKRIRLNATRTEMSNIVRRLNREALVWRQLRHKYILPFIGMERMTFPEHLPCLISPWMESGTLWDFISEDRDEGRERLRLAIEVAEGIRYLHTLGIVHSDIKAANIYMSEDVHIQLADFGLTGLGDTITTGAATATTEHSTVRWAAPEIHNPEQFGFENFKRTRATDIYAFGGLCVELFTGRRPFSHVLLDMNVPFRIVNGEEPAQWSPTFETRVPLAIWHFIARCWSTMAVDRPSIEDIVISLNAFAEGNTPVELSTTGSKSQESHMSPHVDLYPTIHLTYHSDTRVNSPIEIEDDPQQPPVGPNDLPRTNYFAPHLQPQSHEYRHINDDAPDTVVALDNQATFRNNMLLSGFAWPDSPVPNLPEKAPTSRLKARTR